MIRVFLAFDDATFGQRLSEYLDLPLLVVAEEVGLEIKKAALAHGDAVFPKKDHPAALAQNARALY